MATVATTLTADQEGPVVGFFQSSESELWEDAAYGGCPSQQQSTEISAIVADSSGVSGVELSWDVGTSSGTVEMTESAANVYSATIGPFAESTLSGSDAPIALELTAVDSLSNATMESSGSLVLLHDCVIG